MNPLHYAKLMQTKNTKEWNEWRQEERKKGRSVVELAGAYVRSASFPPYEDEKSKKLVGLDLKDADLRYSNFVGSTLISADFTGADLTGANFTWANLSNCIFKSVNLSHSHFEKTVLTGTKIWSSNLSSTSFDFSVVDGGTLIFSCDISNSTSFLGVGLNSARIDTQMLPYLQYAIRKKSWESWYQDTIFNIYNENIEGNDVPQETEKYSFSEKVSKFMFLMYKNLVKLFWICSDYGGSTLRIIGFFVLVNIVFSMIYHSFGIVQVASPFFFTAIPQTFLVVFGIIPIDLSPVPNVLLHIAVMFHVILGYLLLAALVTRLSILFQSTGPDKLHWRKKFYEK
ncbi:pentapeptide repeat-containing protein [Methanorbis furvi]|uniref:Pentapeptide repeat-containing protein n=1 Tax=Methanorbis furvi TaxID=3028299 RepID=A0AAE4S9Z3_9EURY|nr:hypothetical protein [Methanocorpusculaceae archaeon Ag1]